MECSLEKNSSLANCPFKLNLPDQREIRRNQKYECISILSKCTCISSPDLLPEDTIGNLGDLVQISIISTIKD
jgi:hypothetical protein